MSRVMRTGLLLVPLVIIAAFPVFMIQDNTDAAAQLGEKGYFEGDVPLRGVYLQSINCYPPHGEDQNEDGVMDAGFAWDFDDDGVEETHYLEDPLIVDLADNGFYPGDMIMISHKQSVHNVIWNQIYYFPLFGLFSTSPDLLRDDWRYTPSSGALKWPMIGPVNRVPGAIDAALGGYVHGPGDNTNTWKQGQEVENDILEDFQIWGYGQYNEGSNGVQWTPDTWVFTNGFWIRIPPGARYLFIQRAGYWFLDHVGYIRITIDKDTDGDAIPDSWEKDSVDFNKDGNPDLVLKDADFEHKDLYVEIDYMGTTAGCPGHEPDAGALQDVATAFASSPVENPDSQTGITAHFDVAEADEIPHKAAVKVWEDFDALKNGESGTGGYFGTEAQRNDQNARWMLMAKKYTYHYCLFVHALLELNTTTGRWEATTHAGIAECPGNDFIVSLGKWSTNPGTRDQQAASFMHELGHNLGLNHGGSDDINYKPNYLSIMNYLFEFDKANIGRPLDYSRQELPTLNEQALDELNGLGQNEVNTYAGPWYQTVFSYWDTARTPPDQLQITLLMPIDWNNDGSIDPDIACNLNHFPRWSYPSPSNETLRGWDDWANLNFYFPLSGGFADGAHPDVPAMEITWEIAEAIQDAFLELDPLPMPAADTWGLPVEAGYAVVAISAVCVVVTALVIFRKERKSGRKPDYSSDT